MAESRATLASLQSRLASALPLSVQLLIHHVVSEKFACPELFSAPPGKLPESTTSESHLLSVSIKHNGQPLQTFALEVYVYETDSLTTIFISKADSTGYLHLLRLPTGTRSPIKTVTTTFLEWLIESKRRLGIRLLLSLFARAQNQYLFPASIDNSGKHVLNDRELIRWWCRVLDPMLLKHTTSESVHAHLVVPGLDPYETRSYFPKSSPQGIAGKPTWTANDPLRSLGKPDGLPPRCYIPRFPDDPKARFALDLDDELLEQPENTSIEMGRSPGLWRSAKSLAQFWELMSFRQECSAGRLVGFVWVVFESIGVAGDIEHPVSQSISTVDKASGSSTSTMPSSQGQQSITSSTTHLPSSLPLPSSQDDLPSPITPPQSQRNCSPESQAKKTDSDQNAPRQADATRVDEKSSGLILNETAYKRILLTLDSLDYANLEVALESTAKFLQTVSHAAAINDDWGVEVVGTKIEASIVTPTVIPTTDSDSNNNPSVNVISAGLVRKKKRVMEETLAPSTEVKEPETRILSGGLVRKKPKV